MGPIYRLHPGPHMGTIWAMLVFTSGSYVGPTWYQDCVFIWVLQYGPHMVSILSFFWVQYGPHVVSRLCFYLGPIWAPHGINAIHLGPISRGTKIRYSSEWARYGLHMVSMSSIHLGPIWAPRGTKIRYSSGSLMGPTWYQCPLFIWVQYGPHVESRSDIHLGPLWAPHGINVLFSSGSNMGPTWYQD